MRVTGNTDHWEYKVWQAGLYHRFPEMIDHTIIAMALDTTGGSTRLGILMDDVSKSLVPPGEDVVPDHLTVYCNVWPGLSSRTSVPSPGKQSTVDHTRLPSAAMTVKACSVPETSRWQVSVPVLAITTPTTGWAPAANDGAEVIAVTAIALSGQISLPWAS